MNIVLQRLYDKMKIKIIKKKLINIKLI